MAEDQLLVIAPLMLDHDLRSASFLGDTSVCDYLDFAIAPGRETEFFICLMKDLQRNKINQLTLQHVRADSFVLKVLKEVVEFQGCRMSCQAADVAMAVDLSNTWAKYLAYLPGKHRHEIRRKLRRLYNAGKVSYVLAEHPLDTEGVMDTFIRLFGQNSTQKAAFMNDRMAGFFRALARGLAQVGILKLFTLQIESNPAAVVMCFDFQSTRYLYNNAYDKQFSHLSVGLLSKVLSLKDAIASDLKTYDFLKGGEVYKKRLGGKPLTLFNCRVDLI